MIASISSELVTKHNTKNKSSQNPLLCYFLLLIVTQNTRKKLELTTEFAKQIKL
jgi:hypothetical protein